MRQKLDKFNKNRLRSSYISVIVSMTLVLFLLGILSTVLYHSKSLANKIQENVAFSALIKTDSKPVMVKQFQRQLELSEHIKRTKFISKEDAAKNLEKDLGEEFLQFLGFNPITDAIDIHFHAYYTKTNQLHEIEKELMAVPVVQEVIYDKSLITMINENIEKLTYALLILSLAFMIIAVALINSSIRLTIYSKRFLIKTMQLVGATKSFIRKPFIWKSILHGFIAATIAIISVEILTYYCSNFFPELQKLHTSQAKIILYSCLGISGMLIPWICTYFAVRKYLKLTTDQLHY